MAKFKLVILHEGIFKCIKSLKSIGKFMKTNDPEGITNVVLKLSIISMFSLIKYELNYKNFNYKDGAVSPLGGTSATVT